MNLGMKVFKKRINTEAKYADFEKHEITDSKDLIKMFKWGHILSCKDKNDNKKIVLRFKGKYYMYDAPETRDKTVNMVRISKHEVLKHHDFHIYIYIDSIAVRKDRIGYIIKLVKTKERRAKSFPICDLLIIHTNDSFENKKMSLYESSLILSVNRRCTQIFSSAMLTISKFFGETIVHILESGLPEEEDICTEESKVDLMERYSKEEFVSKEEFDDMINHILEYKKKLKEKKYENTVDNKIKSYLREQKEFFLFSLLTTLFMDLSFTNMYSDGGSMLLALMDFLIALMYFLNHCVINKEESNRIHKNFSFYYPNKNDSIRFIVLLLFNVSNAIFTSFNLSIVFAFIFCIPLCMFYMKTYNKELKEKYGLNK